MAVQELVTCGWSQVGRWEVSKLVLKGVPVTGLPERKPPPAGPPELPQPSAQGNRTLRRRRGGELRPRVGGWVLSSPAASGLQNLGPSPGGHIWLCPVPECCLHMRWRQGPTHPTGPMEGTTINCPRGPNMRVQPRPGLRVLNTRGKEVALPEIVCRGLD